VRRDGDLQRGDLKIIFYEEMRWELYCVFDLLLGIVFGVLTFIRLVSDNIGGV
jgi:hypothetical protein